MLRRWNSFFNIFSILIALWIKFSPFVSLTFKGTLLTIENCLISCVSILFILENKVSIFSFGIVKFGLYGWFNAKVAINIYHK